MVRMDAEANCGAPSIHRKSSNALIKAVANTCFVFFKEHRLLDDGPSHSRLSCFYELLPRDSAVEDSESKPAQSTMACCLLLLSKIVVELHKHTLCSSSSELVLSLDVP